VEEGSLRRFLGGTAFGALLMYLLDPVWGYDRRADLLAKLRRVVSVPALPAAVSSPPAHDDETLARKVESVVFREVDVPRDLVAIRADHGVIELRGHVPTEAQADALKAAAGRVRGVLYIRNLLEVGGRPPGELDGARRPSRAGVEAGAPQAATAG
jgi:hypothetical protein